MDFGAAAGSIVGGLLGARATRNAASKQLQAAQEEIALQRELADRAADAAKFRAVGFTSPYATPSFDVDSSGNLVGVETQLSPALQGRFDALQAAAGGMFGSGLERAQDMRRQELADQYFGLGQEQLGSLQLDPMQAAAERTARMQELLAPQRAAQQEQLFGNLASKGLTGFAVDQGTGQQVNPYAAALAQTQAQQDRDIAARSLDLADEQIANQLTRSKGLFDMATQQEIRQGQQADLALAPYQSLFGAGQDIYNIGLTEQDRAMNLADTERQRRIAAATGQAQFLSNAGAAASRGASNAAMTSMAGQLGLANALGNVDFGQLDFGGLFNRNSAGTNPTTGLANYSAAPLPGSNGFLQQGI